MLYLFLIGTGAEVKIQADNIPRQPVLIQLHAVVLQENPEQTVVQDAGGIVVSVSDAKIIAIQSSCFNIENFNSCFVNDNHSF